MKCFLLSFLLLALSASLFAQSDGDRLYDPSFLHEIRFESQDDSFFELLFNTWSNSPFGENPYHPGNVRIDGQLVDSVGVRIKGGLSAFNQKRPLKIDFNAYVSGQDFDGIKKLNLLNADYDPAVQRDILGYYIFRQAGVKAPRAAYAKVFFNDVFHGVYILVEQVDKPFLKNQFSSDAGTLYKNKICEIEVESGEETLAHYNEMIEIANTLSGFAFQTAIEQVLDTDGFLRFFLVEHFINAVDNPIDVDCNYYIYHIPDSDLLYWIPWDLNYAFHPGQHYSLLHNGINNVFKRMMETPVYKQRYMELACEMLDYLFTEDNLHPFIDQNAQLIRATVEIDPRYDYNITVFDQDILALKSLMTARRQDFLNDLASASFDCPNFEPPVDLQGISINEFVASNDSIGGIADPQGSFPDWIELYNNTSDAVSMYNFYLSNDKDFLKHWRFPDGTVLEPGEYLIVWADRDTEEDGLHADFKLDKDSGSIFLAFEDHTILDSISYGTQETNVAFARFPNGTGLFKKQASTFAQNNGGNTGQTEPISPIVLSTFPNPTKQTLNIELSGLGIETPITYSLFNMLGQPLARKITNTASCKVDLTNWLPGVYMLTVEFENRLISKRIVLGQY